MGPLNYQLRLETEISPSWRSHTVHPSFLTWDVLKHRRHSLPICPVAKAKQNTNLENKARAVRLHFRLHTAAPSVSAACHSPAKRYFSHIKTKQPTAARVHGVALGPPGQIWERDASGQTDRQPASQPRTFENPWNPTLDPEPELVGVGFRDGSSPVCSRATSVGSVRPAPRPRTGSRSIRLVVS